MQGAAWRIQSQNVFMHVRMTSRTPMYMRNRRTRRRCNAQRGMRVIRKRHVAKTVCASQESPSASFCPAATGRTLLWGIHSRSEARAETEPYLHETALLVPIRVEGTLEASLVELDVRAIALRTGIDRRDTSSGWQIMLRHVTQTRNPK